MADTTSRYAVYVPDPKTRLNLGKPEGGDDKFGYKGASIHTKENMFVDISKTTLMQTGSAMYLTSGGSWTQVGKGGVTVASYANSMWAAAGKVLLAAGSGMSQSKVGTHGDAPSGAPYNSLGLHYQVESVHNTLRKLFFGKDFAKLQQTSNSKQSKWATTKGKYEADGMLGEIAKLLDELGFAPDSDEDLFKQLLQQLEGKGDHLTSNMKKASVIGSFNDYDPYYVSGYVSKKLWTRGLAIILQISVFLTRMADVLAVLVAKITNNELIKRIKHFTGAVKAFTGILAKVKPKEWEKYGGDVWKSAAGKWNKKIDDFSGFSDVAEAAELMSAAEMYDISSLLNASLMMNVAKGGPDIPLDLSPYANDQPAVHVITMGAELGAIRVAHTADGTLTLAGRKLTWEQTNSQWVDEDADDANRVVAWPPDGFVDEGGILKQDGGGLFTAEVSDGVTFTDATFEGFELDVEVDGTTHTVQTAGMNGLTAAARATGAASVLSGVAGISATASGDQVTITTTSTGPDAAIALFAKTPEHVSLGLSGNARGTAGGQMSAGQLAKLINQSTTAATATVVNGAVHVVHNTEGNSSHLKFHSPLPAGVTQAPTPDAATTLFGANPSQDDGKDASAFDRVSEFESIVGYMEGWPGTLGVWVAPVIGGIRQVAGVWGQIVTAAKKIKAIFLGSSWTQGIGMIAGDGGFNVGTSGGIYQAGGTVTLVAMGDNAKVPKDWTRFNPLFEYPVYKISKWEGRFKKYMEKKFKPTEDPKKQGASGFRIVSSEDVVTMARRNIRHVAQNSYEVYGASVEMIARDKVYIGARKHGAVLEARHIQIGSEFKDDPQEATESVSISANDQFVRITTKALGVWLQENSKTVAVGSRKSGASPPAIDYDKGHLLVDGARVAIGNIGGGNRRGVIVDGGDVTIDAKSTATIGAGGKTGVEVSASGVAVSGKFEVGSALTVNGTPMPLAPLVELATLDPNVAKIAALTPKYTAVVALAKTLKKAILALNKSIQFLDESETSTIPLMTAMMDKKREILVKNRIKQEKALTEARAEWLELVVSARALCVEDILSKVSKDRAEFEISMG